MKESKNTLDTVLRLVVVGILLFWSFWIVSPFILPLIWSVIIAVAVFPIYRPIEKMLGGRKSLGSIVFTAIMVTLLILPLWAVSGSLIEYTQSLSDYLSAGTFHIPEADPAVKSWPLIGNKVFEFWQNSSENLPSVLVQFEDQILAFSSGLLEMVAGLGFTMIQFLFSTIIAGVFLAHRDSLIANFTRLVVKLSGPDGASFIPLTGATIRSIAQGVIGIAALQGLFSYFGFWLADVPGASFWALGVLVLAIVQLPPSLLILPIIFYVFYANSTSAAVIFTIYMLAVSVSDTFLKPIFLGRGVDVPMLAILIGAIGGMIAFGIIGLFVGSVVLAIFYKLYQVWLNAEA